MKCVKICLALFILLATNCIVTSVHPLYQPGEQIFEPHLIGMWKEKGSSEALEFSRIEDDLYEFTLYDDQQAFTFRAGLVRLDDELFLDISPSDEDDAFETYFGMHLLPLHSFMHVTVDAERLTISHPDVEWFTTFLEESPGHLPYLKRDEQITLTADTAALQGFFRTHLTTPNAFTEADTLWRLP